ncbi:hypothetical protein [Chryseobacterium sp.]|uniref:hypothetical protein n=1 Tax=Chryseobacterium sp. TaxID=1871047 RepID=UPI00261E2947|nr:hypothetical protein [Chryseobacterium sp.]
MKKLNVSQMENLQGNGKGRDCALMGATTPVAGGIGAFMGPAGATMGLWTGAIGAISMGCFS